MVLKNNDKICVSISIGKYIITFHLFSVLYQRRYRCWKYRKWGSHLKNCYHYAKVVENARINFSISPYCTLLFSRKENFKFFEVALSAVLCNGAVGCIMNVWGYQHWNTANTTLDIYLLFENGHKSTQTRCKVCSNLTSVLQQLTFVLLLSFLLTLNTFHTLL